MSLSSFLQTTRAANRETACHPLIITRTYLCLESKARPPVWRSQVTVVLSVCEEVCTIFLGLAAAVGVLSRIVMMGVMGFWYMLVSTDGIYAE